MNYHIISISNAGHGAIFTNKADAKAYQKAHPGSSFISLDHMPSQISTKGKPVKVSSLETSKPSINTEVITPKVDIVVFTDGACQGNPGPAGSGVVIMQNDNIIHTISEPLGYATNNIAELTAIKLGLEYLTPHKNKSITLFTDSQYCIGSLTKNWKSKANVELIASIKQIVRLFTDLDIKFVKAHSGHFGNEQADGLAVAARKLCE